VFGPPAVDKERERERDEANVKYDAIEIKFIILA
jgi:hypothetical protein